MKKFSFLSFWLLVCGFFGSEFVIRRMTRQCDNKRVLIYGAGELGLMAHEYLHQSAKVVAYADSFAIATTEKNEVPLINIKDINSLNNIDVVLVASVSFVDDMMIMLENQNIEANIHVLTPKNCWSNTIL